MNMKNMAAMALSALLCLTTTGAMAQTTYTVTVKEGTEDAAKWTADPNPAQAGQTVTVTYSGTKKVKSVKAVKKAAPAGNTVDLSTLTADYEAQDGDVLTNETTSYKVTIAAGATVTLDGATISGSSYCIKCLGSATIILKDGTTNTLTSTSHDYPALSAGDAGTTLTIQGSTGALNVQSGINCAGIGGGYNIACGNIEIQDGTVTATGGMYAAGIGGGEGGSCGTISITGGTVNATSGGGGAGIGSGSDAGCGNISISGGTVTANGVEVAAGIGSGYSGSCGDISITGGTVNATGGSEAAGIGTGVNGSCDDISITNDVTSVTATKGDMAEYSIGPGVDGSCGTVTIGGEDKGEGVEDSPYTYPEAN